MAERTPTPPSRVARGVGGTDVERRAHAGVAGLGVTLGGKFRWIASTANAKASDAVGSAKSYFAYGHARVPKPNAAPTMRATTGR